MNKCLNCGLEGKFYSKRRTLILIDKDKIKPYLDYAKINYGKNFIEQYEPNQ